MLLVRLEFWAPAIEVLGAAVLLNSRANPDPARRLRALFTLGIITNLRAGDLLRLRVYQVCDVAAGDAIGIAVFMSWEDAKMRLRG
jgi:hypothetical protein